MRWPCKLLSIALAGSSGCLFSQVVYVANSAGSVSAYTINATSGALTVVPGSPFPAGNDPSAVAVDPSGNFVYVANVGGNSNTVSAYDVNPGSGALTVVPGSPFPAGPRSFLQGGLAVDPSGKFVYVINSDSVSAYTINASSGALTAVPGSPFPVGPDLRAVVVHPSGKFVYVAGSLYSNSINNVWAYTIDSGSGALTPIPGSPFKMAGFVSSVLATDPAGQFLFVIGSADIGTEDISTYLINTSTGALTGVPGPPVVLNSVITGGLDVNPTGKFLYVPNPDLNNIAAYNINASNGVLTAIGGSPFATGAPLASFGGPSGVAVDPAGKFVYVTYSNLAAPGKSTFNILGYAINASGALTPLPGSPFPIESQPSAIAIHNLPAVPPLPAITSLAPGLATAGGLAFTLTVTGTGFLSGATVQWNGSPLPTTFSSATQLSAAVPANLIATTGTASVTVAGAGGAISKAVSFTINPAVISVFISSNGVVNAASNAGGAVSPGEIVTISGSNFGPSAFTGYQLDSNGYVTTSLAGTQALFDGIPAPLLSAQAGQVSAVVPYEVSGNPSTQVQVSSQGQSSSAVAVPVAVAAPGIFTVDGSGGGQGMIANQDGTANAPGNPASVGSTVLVYATGEGQTVPAGVDGKPGDSPAPVPIQTVTATIGGLDAPVLSAGGISGMAAGFVQVSVQIPQGVTAGASVPIVLNIGGFVSQANLTLAIF